MNIINNINIHILLILVFLVVCYIIGYKIIRDLKIRRRLYQGGKEPITMAWVNSQEYTPEEANKFISVVKKHAQEFRPFTEELLSEIRIELEHTPGTKTWSDEQIISTWHMFATQNHTRSYNKLNNIPENVLTTLDASHLLSISREYGVSPLALVKRALITRGYPKSAAEKWIANPGAITDNQIYDLVMMGWENDSQTPTTEKILSEKSREYEIQVERMLRKAGLVFKTQEDLVKEQMELYNRAVTTPDFLFPEPVIFIVKHPDGNITEHKVRWIDVKNYMFLGASFITGSIKKQSSRYFKEFGPGALLFHYGFVNSHTFSGAVMLSGQPSKKIK